MHNYSNVLPVLIMLVSACGTDLLSQRSRPVSPPVTTAAGDPGEGQGGDSSFTADSGDAVAIGDAAGVPPSDAGDAWAPGDPSVGDAGFGACGVPNNGPGIVWQAFENGVPPRAGHALVAHSGLWAIGGYDAAGDRADVWWSANGDSWSERSATAPFLGRRWFGSTAFAGRLWVVAGNRGGGSLNLADVWSSSDGSTWLESTDAAMPARHAPVLLSFDGYLWIIGGEGPNCVSRADVYRSADGVAWDLVSANGGFGARDWHAAAVHDGRMWVSGGVYRGIGCDADYLSDVWSSSDGITWTLAAADAFPARSGHAMVAAAGRLWVIGGTAAWPAASYADVWVSDDGVAWCQVTDDAAFGARFDHAAAGTRDALWLVGGYDGAMRGDGWHSP